MENLPNTKMRTTFKDYIAEGIEDVGILKAIFLAGTPGSGKSYTLSKIQSGKISPRIVNTDKALEFLAKQYGVSLDSPDATGLFLDKSLRLTKAQLTNYLNGMLPLFIDGTSSNISNLLARSGILESLGYDVGLIFVNTDLETSILRDTGRDRKVGKDFIKQVYDLAEENKQYYASKFEYFVEIDNNDGQLTDAVIRKAYKSVTNFFNSPIKNPIGKRLVDKMAVSKDKYLVPNQVSQAELSKKIESWYRD